MEIVTSSSMIKKFRSIKEFSLDLGLSKTNEVKKEGSKGPGQIHIQIRDPFVKRYYVLTGNYIVKTGNVGSLSFYLDNLVASNEFIIYDKDKEYKFIYNGDSENIREYLSDKLDKVLNNEIEAKELEMNMEEKIEFNLDKNLPQREFLEKQKEMNEEMSKMNINIKK